MEKDITADKDQLNQAPSEVEPPPDLVFPPAAKYEVIYTKANGETNKYLISNPIEEDADSFTAYVFGRGVRTFIKRRVSSFNKTS